MRSSTVKFVYLDLQEAGKEREPVGDLIRSRII